MTAYRYVATNLLTGQVLADNLPVVVQSASRQINAAGSMTGYLDLSIDRKANSAYINALTPRRSVFWILQDGYPVWGGIVWDTPHQSILSNQLPINAQTLESLFQYRLINSALAYTNTDIFDIARGLVNYATALARGPNAQVAGLVLPAGKAGVTDTLTFGVSNTLQAGPNLYTGAYATNQQVLSALTSTAAADQFEFTLEPTLTPSGGYGWALRLGYPALGQYGTPTQVLTFPGNAIDYARPIMGSHAANQIIVTSTANGTGTPFVSQSPHGVDGADLSAGFPLQQVPVSWPGVGVTSQAQANQYADQLLGAYTAGTMVPSVTLGGTTEPLLRELGLGDAIWFSATSVLDPADPATKTPGLQVQARISGWTLTPPADQQAEKIVLNLGALVGQVSTGTVS